MSDVRIKIKTNLSTGMLPNAQRIAAKRHLRELLANLPEGSTAYIAGGAPRDWHHGWGCRDVDIFYTTPESAGEAIPQYVLDKAKPVFQQYGKGYYYDLQGIKSVHEYPVYQGSLRHRKIQLIRTTSNPETVIRMFPINMSQIWMNSSGKITGSVEYKWGYNNKTMLECNGTQWVYPYIRKLLPRYDEYMFMPKKWRGKRATEEQL
jgi:hypothetical protein